MVTIMEHCSFCIVSLVRMKWFVIYISVKIVQTKVTTYLRFLAVNCAIMIVTSGLKKFNVICEISIAVIIHHCGLLRSAGQP